MDCGDAPEGDCDRGGRWSERSNGPGGPALECRTALAPRGRPSRPPPLRREEQAAENVLARERAGVGVRHARLERSRGIFGAPRGTGSEAPGEFPCRNLLVPGTAPDPVRQRRESEVVRSTGPMLAYRPADGKAQARFSASALDLRGSRVAGRGLQPGSGSTRPPPNVAQGPAMQDPAVRGGAARRTVPDQSFPPEAA